MSIRRITNSSVFTFFVLAALSTIPPATAADTCNSVSGTSCSINCSCGTLSLSCGQDTKSCSGSCSDTKGNLEVFLGSLARDVYLAGEQKVKKKDIITFLQQEPYSHLLQQPDAKVSIGDYRFVIRIGHFAPNWTLSGRNYQSAISRVETVFLNATDAQIRSGVFLSDLSK